MNLGFDRQFGKFFFSLAQTDHSELELSDFLTSSQVSLYHRTDSQALMDLRTF
jgi:hypothetical protein